MHIPGNLESPFDLSYLHTGLPPVIAQELMYHFYNFHGNDDEDSYSVDDDDDDDDELPDLVVFSGHDSHDDLSDLIATSEYDDNVLELTPADARDSEICQG